MKNFFADFLMAECKPTDLILKPLLLLGFRLYVAKAFFDSGLTKIQSWSTTLDLFRYEYSVPLLSPEIAAWLGTATELIVPVVIAFGLLTRPAALVLFIFNIVAATSYPDISPAGEWQHVVWGVMLAVVFVFGPGKISLDLFLSKYLKR
ncbi:MAG: DoxX family protein [Pseudomonadota bacterium]